MKQISTIIICFLTFSLSYSQEMHTKILQKNYIYTLRGKKGLVDLNSKMVTQPLYEEISSSREGLYAAGKIIGAEVKYGYLNEQGEEICDFKFYDAYTFRNGYAAVKLTKESSWTFINKDFKPITNRIFLLVKDFCEGFAEVKVENGKWTFINTRGDLLCNETFDETSNFENDFAIIKVNQKYGYIHKSGLIKIKPAFTQCNYFQKHKVAMVATGKKDWKIINENGEIIPKDSTIKVDYPVVFDNGLVSVSKKDKNGNTRYGYMNLKEQIIIPIIYESITGFHHHSLTGGKLDNVVYLIDENGRQRVKTDYSTIQYYYEGPVALVYKIFKNDELKKMNIQPGDFDFDIIKNTGLTGAIDSVGEVSIPVIYKNLMPVYSQIYDNYFNQCLFTAVKPKSKLEGVISDYNEVIVPFLFENISYICKDAFLVTKKNENFIYRSSTRKIIKLSACEYVSLSWINLKENHLLVKDKVTKLVGLLNIDGNYSIKPQFDDLNRGYKKDNKK